MGRLDDGSDFTAQPIWLPPGARGRLMGDTFCFASTGLISRACRHSVTLVQALEPDKPLRVGTAQGLVEGQLILVPPQTERTLNAEHSPFLMVDVEPIHIDYRVLAGVGGRVGTLDHLAFDALRQVGQGFLHDGLHGRELDHAVREALSQLTGHFPRPPALDPRVRWMMTEIQSDPGRPLTEVAQMAGFADSAHFAKVWTRCYGAPPSVYFPVDRMQVDHSALPRWIQPPRY